MITNLRYLVVRSSICLLVFLNIFPFQSYASNEVNTGLKTGVPQNPAFLKYKVKKDLKPSGLDGISDEQINDHWKLYEGYVVQVNKLNEELNKLDSNSLAFVDRRRRYGFEYNGMVLHEYYFKNLSASKTKLSDGKLKQAFEKNWGSYEKWLQDFINTGKTRGIGWAILYLDIKTKKLINVFVTDHENGHISGFAPLLVMDVWEHAYMVDHKADGRADYIDAFIKNINWSCVEKRFDKTKKIQHKKE